MIAKWTQKFESVTLKQSVTAKVLFLTEIVFFRSSRTTTEHRVVDFYRNILMMV